MALELFSGLALAGCGGKVGALPWERLERGAAGSPGDSGVSAAGGTVTPTGGAGSLPSDDDDDEPEASTDDACPCPARQSAAAGSLVHFTSLSCYCTSVGCPGTMNEAEEHLCAWVEAQGAGEVERGVGCGLARASLTAETISFDWIFEEGTDQLIGLALWGDAPSGLCSVQKYLYGELYQCQAEGVCHLCGERRLSLPSCRPLL
ncbi:MAG: hypothetical protein JW940_24170 [Polyangiaceae bacterium]|nr:hypothetical protein [Polyangiaceae bacterium]